MVRIIPRKNKTLGGVLAIFTGTIGLHKFYMGQWKQGLVYLLFFWTGVPTVLGIMDGARLLTQAAEEVPYEDGDNPEETDLEEEKEESIEESEEKDDSEEEENSEESENDSEEEIDDSENSDDIEETADKEQEEVEE